MALETGTYVNDLVITNPVGATDPKSQGDNHLRLIKDVLKATFPSADHAIYLDRPRADIASAGTTAIGGATTNYVNITGTTTITSFGTVASGIWRFIRFNAALTLTHNGTSLILPTAANITTAAGDTAIAVSEGSGNWRVLVYQYASGAPPALSVVFGSLAAALVVTASETIAANLNDTTIPTSSAVNAHVVGQQTIWVPAGAMKARTTNGAAAGSLETTTNDVMIDYYAFDTTTAEAVQFGIQMPKGWNEGTLIAQFVWTHPATTVNFGVVFELGAVAFANDDALDTAFGTVQEIADTGGTTHDVYITSETPAITVAGTPGAEEYVMFQVLRDPANGSDTLAVDAWLLGVKIHYTTDAAKDD